MGDALLSPTLGAALDLYRKPTPLVTNGHASSPESISLRQVLEDPSVPFVDPVEVGIACALEVNQLVTEKWPDIDLKA